jgi:hypothetical protein
MKKIYLFLVLTLSLISCSVDETPEINSTPIGLEGPEFKITIFSTPYISIDFAIMNQENKPIFNQWEVNKQLGCNLTDIDNTTIIQENTGIALLLIDGENAETFRITLYEHYYCEIGESVVYEISYNDFQTQDYVVFTVGENGICETFKIYRNYNGSQSIDNYEPVYIGNVTQL